MASTPQQQLELLLKAQIMSNPDLAGEKIDYAFSGRKVTIRVASRLTFKSTLEETLKKNKVKYKSKSVGSSVEGTEITFDNGMTLTVVYKQSSGSKPPTAKTQWQELGTAYIFTQALVHNVKYSSPSDILMKEEKELKKIFQVPSNKDFPYDDWLEAFYYQQKVMIDKYGSPKFSRFDRDGGFMEYITKLVNVKFGISKKDTWNPADVWAIDGSEASIEKTINDEMAKFPDYKELEREYSNNPALLEDKIRVGIIKLNAVLIDLLKKEKVIGVSLKLTDKNAHIEEVNIKVVQELVKNNKELLDTASSPFIVEPRKDFTCKFDVPAGKDTFTQDVIIAVKDEKGTEYRFQIKANSSEAPNGSNLKFEATIKGKSKARAGKVPVDILAKIIQKIPLKGSQRFVNDYTKYPRNITEFVDALPEYKDMFSKMSAKGIQFGVDVDGFVGNVSSAFSSGKGATITNTTCKLMGFGFMYMLLCQMSENEMKELLTDMAFLAQKKNTRKLDTFGPFIKIS